MADPVACPVPYTIRNTFIDLPGGEDPAEGIFSTWHHPARRQGEDGEEDGALPALAPSDTAPGAAPGLAAELPGARGPAELPDSSRGARIGARIPLATSPEEGSEEDSSEEGRITSEPAEGSEPEGSRITTSELHTSEPYTVRNTFIDLPGEGPAEGTFSTWHHPARRQGVDEDTEEGRITSEEGEITDDEDLEDGQLPDESRASSKVPPTAQGPAPSAGSAGHAAGTCRPCAWMHKSAEGCRSGERCEYCHLCPPGELKRRKQAKMQQRMTEVHHARERQAANEEGGPAGPAGLLSPSAPRPAGAAQVVASVLAMEPCYIDLPGLTANAAGRTSVGSMDHATRQCRPCAWVHKDASGCRSGALCQYCHLCPPGELKRRKRQKWEVK